MGFWLALGLSGLGVSGPEALAQVRKGSPALTLRFQPALAGADSLVLVARVELPPGWHINSEAPEDSLLVGTRLETSAPGMDFGKPRFPAPVKEFSAVMGGELWLYKGVFEVAVPGKRRHGRADRTGSLPPARATLVYQACDGTMCLPPKSVSAETSGGMAPEAKGR